MSGNERFELISIKRLSNNNYVDNMYRVLHVVLNNNYEMIVQLSSCSTNRIKMYHRGRSVDRGCFPDGIDTGPGAFNDPWPRIMAKRFW